MTSSSHPVDPAWAYLKACPKSTTKTHAWNADRTRCTECGARRVKLERFASDGMQHPEGQWVAYEEAFTLAIAAEDSKGASDVSTERAFELGWRLAAQWAGRDDLVSDIGSPAYLREMRDAIEKARKKTE